MEGSTAAYPARLDAQKLPNLVAFALLKHYDR